MDWQLSGRHVQAGDYRLWVAVAGSGPTVVFIHGSGPGASAASNFSRNWRAFADAGFRVILPDLIGYGASDKPTHVDYTLDLFTGTLRAALAEVGVESATLVGNSLGGAIAMQIALDDPALVDRLVMMAPGGIETRETYFAMPGIARMVGDFTSPDFTEADQRRLVTNLVHDPVHITDALVAERYAVARQQPKQVLSTMRVPDLSPRLGELTQPILGFWGTEDAFCPASGAQKFLAACPDVRFMLFNKVGHWVMVERAGEFNRHVIDFLTH
ncbi:alpha/beta fold hydrolase [Nitrospirillum bahiense]|uniref:4,5:9,10-diseco-3-hydroxy-5,9, 17-trioxoandrosta-1(10),2-diene-4-oate hydrolase n=1 Tax=Nitrospirillum amazonense TaxID=28077 RepID=A0A560FVS7_9PROT|nr:alpha/beta fold hydrolase [Nitrospirillum amazonense]TWB25661.1 4,5:9,10-diseco-3-hydroxy-5,9,17-trioxoandrosta-1(10),2-diene-4-oate hydrolase [Nitrospirillum amazonense]